MRHIAIMNKRLGLIDNTLSYEKTIESRWYKDKCFCTLVFLENPVPVRSFNINKSGYGSACAWLCVDDVGKISL